MLKLIIAMPCPFCILVTDFIEENKLSDIEVIDTFWNASTHHELQQKYGKTQVPLLLIDETPLYESRDIIEYLRRKYELS